MGHQAMATASRSAHHGSERRHRRCRSVSHTHRQSRFIGQFFRFGASRNQPSRILRDCGLRRTHHDHFARYSEFLAEGLRPGATISCEPAQGEQEGHGRKRLRAPGPFRQMRFQELVGPRMCRASSAMWICMVRSFHQVEMLAPWQDQISESGRSVLRRPGCAMNAVKYWPTRPMYGNRRNVAAYRERRRRCVERFLEHLDVVALLCHPVTQHCRASCWAAMMKAINPRIRMLSNAAPTLSRSWACASKPISIRVSGWAGTTRWRRAGGSTFGRSTSGIVEVDHHVGGIMCQIRIESGVPEPRTASAADPGSPHPAARHQARWKPLPPIAGTSCPGQYPWSRVVRHAHGAEGIAPAARRTQTSSAAARSVFSVDRRLAYREDRWLAWRGVDVTTSTSSVSQTR